MQKLYFSLLFAGITLARCFAQDLSFSQFYATRSYLNPAFTGLEKGLSLTAAYRNHYLAIPQAYTSQLAAVELQEPSLHSAFGIVAVRDVAGEASLTTYNAKFNYAYRLTLTDITTSKVGSELLFGLSVGMIQRSIDWSKLTFLDQIDPVYGFTQPTAAVPITNPVAFFDSGAGVAWRGVFNVPKSKDEMYANAGLVFSHINPSNESLLGKPTVRPLRITLHGGVELPIRWIDGTYLQSVRWSPNIKMEWQDGQFLSTLGAFAQYEGGYLGLFFQNKFPVPENVNTNAFIFAAGMKFKMENDDNMLLGITYDGHTTGLGVASGGSFELVARYNFGNVSLLPSKNARIGKGKAIPCPRNF